MYMRSLLAQANVAHSEFSPGEDRHAVDATLIFATSTVRVQVKCGTKEPNKDGSMTVDVMDGWKAKWSVCKQPVYLVYVRLEKADPPGWIEHAGLLTLMHTRAFWARVNTVTGSSVRIPIENRLCAETFIQWCDEADREG